MSLRIVPPRASASSFAHAQPASSAPSAPGIHDTLRHGLGPSPLDGYTTSTASNTSSNDTNNNNNNSNGAANPPPLSAHPLEARLRSWEATRENLRMQSLRRTFGLAEPVRRAMELKMVRDAHWRPVALGPATPCLHDDILTGRDDAITWEDVFTGQEMMPAVGFHDEMEKKLRI